MHTKNFEGIYVAAVTPLREDGSPAIDQIIDLLQFYSKQGAHGALIFGTTGEGPSFSPEERMKVWEEAVKIKKEIPGFRLIAGTGTPSLSETIYLNRVVFDLGFDAVLSLPPYYFREASDQGLLDWFSELIESSVPADGAFMAYHFPKMCGVSFSISLLKEILERYPNRFIGVKDSSGDFESAKEKVYGLPGVNLFVGNDRLLTKNLKLGGAGSITAASNLISPLMRKIWDDYQIGKDTSEDQTKVDQIRGIVEKLAPFPASMKLLLKEIYGFPFWPVRAPLVQMNLDLIKEPAHKIKEILEI